MKRVRYFKIESFGTVDGPGTRMVLFLQGCPLRCKYCHNPESWDMKGESKEITSSQVIKHYMKNLSFYKNGGGITVSGGEPWLHLDFLIELAQLCKENNIHLTIDTSGYFFMDEFKTKNDHLIELVDLWLIDIKHINPDKYESVTGISKNKQHEKLFIHYLEKAEKPYWIRQVLVPGLTDDATDLENLGAFVANLKYMQKFEILPYHKLMIPKYQNLGLPLPLPGILEPSDEDVKKAKALILKGISANKK